MTGRSWPVADAQYRRILHANAILQRIKAVEVCGIKTRQANSKDRRRTPENPKGDLSGRLFPCSPSTGKSEAPEFIKVFLSPEAKMATLQEFQDCRNWGVRGFPSLLLERDGRVTHLASGYTTSAALIEKLESALTNSSMSS